MKIIVIISSLLTLSFFTGDLQAQEKLELDSLVSLAIQQDYSVQVLSLELEKQQQENRITKASSLPTVTANLWSGYSNGRYYDPLTNQFTTNPSIINSSGITANWNIYNGGYTHLKSNLDEANYSIQSMILEKRKKELAREVTSLYTSVVQSEKLLELHHKKLELFNAESERLRELLRLERITFVDTSLLALKKMETEQETYRLEYKRDMDLAQLSLLTNRQLTTENLIIPEEEPLHRLDLKNPQFTRYNDSTLLKSSSISYRMSQLEIEKAGINSEIQKTQFRPSLKLAAGVYSGYSSNRVFLRSPVTSNFAEPIMLQFRDNTYGSTSLNLYVPIYDRRNRFIQKQGKISHNIAKVEQLHTEKKICTRYQLARKELAIKQQRLKMAHSQKQEAAKISNSFQERYASDRLRKNEWLQAREKEIDWEISYCNSYFDLYGSLKAFEQDYGSGMTY